MSPADPVERCPECLAAVEPDHEFCLQCGHRMAPRSAAPHRVVRSSGVAAALAAVLLLGAGVAIAFGLSHDLGSSSTEAAATVPAYGTTALPVQPIVTDQPTLTVATLVTGIPTLTAPTFGSTGTPSGPTTASLPVIPSSSGAGTTTRSTSSSGSSIPSVTRPTSSTSTTFPSVPTSSSTTHATTTFPTTTTSTSSSTSTSVSTSTSSSSSTNCTSGSTLTPANCDPADGGGPVGRNTWRSDDWPANETGFACILDSEPAGSSSYTRMQARERVAARRGLANLGLLFSDHFTPSLDAGYFVLYSGPFSAYAQATRACHSARSSGYPTAYVRQIAT